MKISNKLNMYLLGGASSKIVSKLSQPASRYNLFSIDTSDSEDILISEEVERTLITTNGQRGSGGQRKTHFDALSKKVPQVIASSNPTDINFVVFSASGASGSTASYIVIDELLKAGKSVIAIVSINATNVPRINNTKKTLSSIHSLATNHEVNIPCYISYEPDMTLAEADEITASFIDTCNAMLSDDIVGIDDMDRRHFLSPVHVDDLKGNTRPSMVSLIYSHREEDVPEGALSSLVLTPLGSGEGNAGAANLVFTGVLDKEMRDYLAVPSEESIVSLSTLKSPPYTLLGTLSTRLYELEKSARLEQLATDGIMDDLPNEGIVL